MCIYMSSKIPELQKTICKLTKVACRQYLGFMNTSCVEQCQPSCVHFSIHYHVAILTVIICPLMLNNCLLLVAALTLAMSLSGASSGTIILRAHVTRSLLTSLGGLHLEKKEIIYKPVLQMCKDFYIVKFQMRI